MKSRFAHAALLSVIFLFSVRSSAEYWVFVRPTFAVQQFAEQCTAYCDAAFKIETGEQQGSFVFVNVSRDKHNALIAHLPALGGRADSAAVLETSAIPASGSVMIGTGSAHLWDLEKADHPSPVDVVRFVVPTSRESDFVLALQKLVEAGASSGMPEEYLWQRVTRSQQSGFILLLPRTAAVPDFASFKKYLYLAAGNEFGGSEGIYRFDQFERSIDAELWSTWSYQGPRVIVGQGPPGPPGPPGDSPPSVGPGEFPPPPPPPDQVPEFPWPVPPWTSRYALPDGLVVSKGQEQMGAAFDRILQALRDASIAESTLFALSKKVNCAASAVTTCYEPDGFAVVAQIEQIENDGTPRPGQERWSLGPLKVRSFPRDFFRLLFSIERGHYRVIVFVVSARVLTSGKRSTSFEEWTDIRHSGAGTMPESLRKKLLPPGAKCEALVYEFNRTTKQELPEILAYSPVRGVDHLAKAGLWSQERLLQNP